MLHTLLDWRAGAPRNLANEVMRRYVFGFGLAYYIPALIFMGWFALSRQESIERADNLLLAAVAAVFVPIDVHRSVRRSLAAWRDPSAAELIAKDHFVRGCVAPVIMFVAGLLLGLPRDMLVLLGGLSVFWLATVFLRRYVFDAWYLDQVRCLLAVSL